MKPRIFCAHDHKANLATLNGLCGAEVWVQKTNVLRAHKLAGPRAGRLNTWTTSGLTFGVHAPLTWFHKNANCRDTSINVTMSQIRFLPRRRGQMGSAAVGAKDLAPFF